MHNSNQKQVEGLPLEKKNLQLLSQRKRKKTGLNLKGLF